MVARRHCRRSFGWLVMLVSLLLGVSVHADFESLRAIHANKLSEIETVDAATRKKLHDWYARELRELRQRIQQEGDLNKVTTVIDEIRRFEEEANVGAMLSELPELARVQKAYQDHAVRIETGRARKVIELASRYDRALAAEEQNLVKQGAIEGAQDVRRERDELKTSEHLVKAQDWLNHVPPPEPAPVLAPAPAPDPARLGSLTDGQWVIIPTHTDKNTREGGQVVTNGVYWLETDQKKGWIEVGFRDIRISSLRPKRRVELRMRVDDHEKAGSSDRVDVMCGNVRVGTFRGAHRDTWIGVPLDPQKLPNNIQLTLQLIPRGTDGLAIRSKSTGEGPELRIQY